ncbi:unnamed protein product [Agarophyton chilense]
MQNNELAAAVHDAIQDLDRSLSEGMGNVCEGSETTIPLSASHGSPARSTQRFEADFGPPEHKLSASRVQGDSPDLQQSTSDDHVATRMPIVGDKTHVYWPTNNNFYGGTVAKHNQRTGKYSINHFDGDKEALKLEAEKWKFMGGGSTVEEEDDDGSIEHEATVLEGH